MRPIQAYLDEDGGGFFMDCPKCHFYNNAVSNEGDPCRNVLCDGDVERVRFVLRPPVSCGGCDGLGGHRRHCRNNPDYTFARQLAAAAEDLGDRIGSNNPGAANSAYTAQALLMEQHWEQILARKAEA